jgi:predicted RNA binding protein YcfA (HicA-like mRNA interferase family)
MELVAVLTSAPEGGTEAVRAHFGTFRFSVVRQRGSYVVLRRDASGCVVLNHRELKAGT